MEKKREAILLIDDEAIVLHSAQRLLERKGYTVFVATDGHYAINVLKNNKTSIGVILLDLSMPGMDGEETLEKLLEVDSEAKVILFSGYAFSKELEPLFRKGAVGHIQKPFELKDLLEKINEIIG